MKLLLPVAGDSTRFPGMRPKWLLTHPEGDLMFYRALCGLELSHVDEIIIICKDTHYNQYDVSRVVEKQWSRGKISVPYRIVPIPATKSQPETIATAIRRENIQGPIFIKDADGYFVAEVKPGNYVCTVNLNEMTLVDAANKSYIEQDSRLQILNIVEKQVISNTFCVGGYSFADAGEFLRSYDSISGKANLYVSHVIYHMLFEKVPFYNQPVHGFLDWGTLAEWERYKKQFASIFIDLDGTLVENSSEYFTEKWAESPPILRNIEILNRLYDTGKVQVIITTARPKGSAAKTEEQLKRCGIRYHQILYDILHAKRVLINDFSSTNSYRSAEAINIPRNEDVLTEMLSCLFEMAA